MYICIFASPPTPIIWIHYLRYVWQQATADSTPIWKKRSIFANFSGAMACKQLTLIERKPAAFDHFE